MKILKKDKDRVERLSQKRIHDVGAVQRFRDYSFAEFIMTGGEGNFSTVYLLENKDGEREVVNDISVLMNRFDGETQTEILKLKDDIKTKETRRRQAALELRDAKSELSRSGFDVSKVGLILAVGIIVGFSALIVFQVSTGTFNHEGLSQYTPFMIFVLVMSGASLIFGRHFYTKLPDTDALKRAMRGGPDNSIAD